jgi:hypothetical protein
MSSLGNLGNLLNGYGIRVCDLTGAGHQQVLINGITEVVSGNSVTVTARWYLGDFTNGQQPWPLVSQTTQFYPSEPLGQMLQGDYTGAGHQQILYFDGASAWWLGDMATGQLSWTNPVVAGMGDDLPNEIGSQSFWVGDFTGAGHQQVLYYAGYSERWFFGDIVSGPLGFKELVSPTAEVGNLVDGFHGVWIGDFEGAGHQQVLSYSGGDVGYWFLGGIADGQLVWKNRISQTAGDLIYDNDKGILVADHGIWPGDFTGAGQQQCLVLDDRNGSWNLGDMANGSLNWNDNVGNSAQYGKLLDSNHLIWIGDFTGAGHQQGGLSRCPR